LTARTGQPIIAQRLFLAASAFHSPEAEGTSMSRREPAIATPREVAG